MSFFVSAAQLAKSAEPRAGTTSSGEDEDCGTDWSSPLAKLYCSPKVNEANESCSPTLEVPSEDSPFQLLDHQTNQKHAIDVLTGLRVGRHKSNNLSLENLFVSQLHFKIDIVPNLKKFVLPC